MTPATFAARLRSVLSRSAPSVGVEIGADHVTAVTVAQNRGAAVLSAYATEPLPAQAVTPAVNGKNVHDPLAVGEALQRALDGLPRRPTRIALVVPDSVAKVSLVRFEQVPARAETSTISSGGRSGRRPRSASRTLGSRTPLVSPRRRAAESSSWP